MSVNDAIAHFVQTLERDGHPLIGLLAPGLDREAIRQRSSAAGHDLPDDLVDLWAWHNGLLAGSDRKLQPRDNEFPGGYDFLSLEQALTEHDRFQQQFPFSDMPHIKPNWMEVFRREGCALRVELNTDQACVRPTNPEWHDPAHPELYSMPSIENLLLEMAELVTEGHWADQGGGWDSLITFDRSRYPWVF